MHGPIVRAELNTGTTTESIGRPTVDSPIVSIPGHRARNYRLPTDTRTQQ